MFEVKKEDTRTVSMAIDNVLSIKRFDLLEQLKFTTISFFLEYFQQIFKGISNMYLYIYSIISHL